MPSAGYKFNSMQEIKSHSSILFNERMAILFYMLDMKSIALNTNFNVSHILEVRGVLKQIYKNIRTLLRNNPTMRVTLDLETKDPGIYITDLALSRIDKLIEYCEVYQYTMRRIYIIVDELNSFETLIKDVLQYFHYFIRPEFKQKPDIELATEKYKEIADKKTIEELRELVGKRHKIDFGELGSDRVELKQEIEYDENIDGPMNKTDMEYNEDDFEEDLGETEDDI